MSTLPHKNHVIIKKKKKKLFYCLRHGYFTISYFQSFDQKQKAEKSIEKEEKKKVYQMVVMIGAEAESQEYEYC